MRRKRNRQDVDCPRCGGDCVRAQPLRELTVPGNAEGFVSTHWLMCLSLKEPVLIGPKRTAPLARWSVFPATFTAGSSAGNSTFSFEYVA